MSLWDERKSGIFMIRNIPNGKMYIGKASDLRSAKRTYFDKLRDNYFPNPDLQDDFNDFNESEFEFEIVEFCSPGELSSRKEFYIDFYNTKDDQNGYNVPFTRRYGKIALESLK